MTTDFDLMRILHATTPRTVVRRGIHLRETSSTQDVVRAAARAGEAGGYVVVADHQTAGRGQFGRSWHDIPGDTLLCSLLLRPINLQPGQTPEIVLHFAQTLIGVLHDAHPRAPIRIKHPNDIIVDSVSGPRKLAGILAEGVVNPSGQQWVALGFGVNITRNPTTQVDGTNLDTRSAAVNDFVSEPFTRTQLLSAVLQRFSIDGF